MSEEIDVTLEASKLAESIMQHWDGYSRIESVIDLEEARAHCNAIAQLLEARLQKEYPQSQVTVVVDGFRRVVAKMEPLE